ncbi:hypothetical protein Tco_0532599 [Tanacetum coccineum]
MDCHQCMTTNAFKKDSSNWGERFGSRYQRREINDKKEQMGYEMNAPGKSVDSFEEGEIIGESDDGCVKDCGILEDHFDGDRGNDTIEDNADVNPSTNVSLEVNTELQMIPALCLHLRPRVLIKNIAKESCSTWLIMVVLNY